MSTINNFLIKYKSILENISYLSAIQIINLVIPIILYPYLINKLGADNYGLIIYYQSIVNYLAILVNFGFNIAATKNISIHRSDDKKISEIVSSVLIIKLVLSAFSFIVIIIISQIINKFQGHTLLLLLTSWCFLYEAIIPFWFFQGIEKMKYISISITVSKLIYLLLVLLFINSDKDILLVPAFNLLTIIIIGIYSFYLIIYKSKIRLHIPTIKLLLLYLKDAIPIFISNISMSIYITSTKVIIGSFIGIQEVAFYDLAEKIVGIFKSPQSIITQVLFPNIAQNKNKGFLKKIFKISLLINLLLTLLLYLFSKIIINILGGPEMYNSLGILYILGINVLVDSISNVIGNLGFIAFGYNRLYTKIISQTTLIFLITIFFLINVFDINTLIVTSLVVICQILTSTLFYIIAKRRNIL